MIKPVMISENGIRRIALGVLLFLFIYEVYIVGANYSNYFIVLAESETIWFAGVACFCFLFSFYLIYFWIKTSLASSWLNKVIFLTIFVVSVVAEYGYQKALGRFSDPQDIETAVFATGEQQTASLLMYLNAKAAVPCVVLLILFVFLRAEKTKGLRDFLIASGLIIVSFSAFPFLISQRFPTISTNAFVRTTTEFLVSGPIASGKWGSNVTGVQVKRRPVAKPQLSEEFRPSNNIVIVVDESVMGDHLSLNGYNRKTTPFLDRLAEQKLLTNWGIAAAASTGSRFTYSSLITGLGPDDFPDKTGFKVNTFPTIYQYAKAMNYRTYFFDGQMNSYWGGVLDDLTYIDNWQGVTSISDGMGFERWDLDNMIARKVKDLLYSSTGNFIFVFKHGAHIPYQSNFPPDGRTWTPSYETANKFDIPPVDLLPSVVNAYDNSIKYNVNSFFENLIDDYSRIPNGTVVIYTGDHGQTLFANGRASHGGNSKPEATVPLFVIGDRRSVDTSYKASHANIFPTVLDLMGYPVELRDAKRFPSLFEAKSADSRPRFYNPDLGIKLPFD